MLVDVFLTFGTLLFAVSSIDFCGAEFTFFNGVGFFILLIAAVVTYSCSAQIKTKLSISTIILLLIVTAANGISDFTYVGIELGF